MTFAHVANRRLRNLLEDLDGPKMTIAQAIDYTDDALASDGMNADIPYQVINAREEAFVDADSADTAEEALVALRRYWSV